MNILNECRLDYKYKLSTQGPIISKTISSNIVSTKIIQDSLKVAKRVNKEFTFNYDILIYTITIENISKFIINNIFFKDNIPKNTKFIENSVTINKSKFRCINPQNGFIIDIINPESIIVITFKVVVLPICSYNIIENSSMIEYDYIYNIEKPPYIVNKESNKVISIRENRVFKQTIIGNIINIPDEIDQIVSHKNKIYIIKIKIISSINYDLYTLLVIGKVNVNMVYKSGYRYKQICEDRGFSECMTVPKGMILDNENDIKYCIESTSVDLIDNNSIYNNIILLLYF